MLLSTIIDELRAWWEDTPPLDPPSHFFHAVTAQRALGWHSFLLGYVSLECRTLLQSKKSSIHRIMTTIWKAEAQLWKLRNNQQHTKETSERNSNLHAQLRSKVCLYYSYADDIDLDNIRNHMFREPLTTFLQQSTRVLQTWLTTFKPLLQVHLRRKQRNRERGLRTITEFFPSTRRIL